MKRGRLYFFETEGHSMRPFLRPGERIIVRAAGPGEIRAGDIAVYRNRGAVVCHRLAGKSGGTLYTRGDAMPRPPEAVPGSALIGKAVGLVRGGRVINLESGPQRLLGKLMLYAPLLARIRRTA